MEGDYIKINKALLPLSWIYGLGVGVRNLLFEMDILKSKHYSIPVISVGNITVGGTGKTPHVEYLIRLLKDKLNVAVLSRGYKRKSSGFVLAGNDTSMADIGDEPFQMKQKFPEVTVAVDSKRTRGIEKLTSHEGEKSIDVILLDDAFQHRYVKPGINILLVDYHRLIIYDQLLPAGRLREPVKSKDRADIVIVTKCPKEMKPMEFRVLTKAMNLYPYQQLYFSTHDYDAPKPLFPDEAEQQAFTSLESLAGKNVLMLTGIASPQQMEHDLMPHAGSLSKLSFSDHHAFTAKDIRKLNDTFSAMTTPKLVITTEKDATRLATAEGMSQEVRSHLFVLPIHVSIMLGQENDFNNFILSYLHKNSKNSTLVKSKKIRESKEGNPAGKPQIIRFK